ncbi:cupin domain-containing protein [Sanguibacter sp. HDW7]|uniref:cupin domain-containing protein n=1 Tax=Sanguibacter sp. HDW7 TaxID=2714931 RepID=UPI00140B4B3A|nr:cupin domain-containing protein [Sanguibacter sp. HDW7]QIK83862.1 cupin [Sanguibacter sp. HDW7]
MTAPSTSFLADLGTLAPVQEESTVSRTVLRADGVRVVVFAFDAGQVLTEHTAAMPVLLSVLDGHLRVVADGTTHELVPGALLHMATRVPHSVEAIAPSRLVLTMLDARATPATSAAGLAEA